MTKLLAAFTLALCACGATSSVSSDANDDNAVCECSGVAGGQYVVPNSASGHCGQVMCSACGVTWASMCSSGGEWECVQAGGPTIPTCDAGQGGD